MIGAIAKLKIKDGERDNFIEAMGNLVKAVAENEPDCFYYEMHETDDPLTCLLYTSPSPRDRSLSRMPSSA